MIQFIKPEGFSPHFRVAGCFIEVNGHFLLLKRAAHDDHGSVWGAPGGGIEDGEEAHQAVVRELKEETGLMVDIAMVEPVSIGYVTIDGTSKQFEYHMYILRLDSIPELVLNPDEHSDFTWVSPEESLQMTLIHDMDDCIRQVWLS